MSPAISTLFIALIIFLHAAPVEAAHHIRLPNRTRMVQTSPAEATQASANDVWKFSILGLAGLSFLIRKRALQL